MARRVKVPAAAWADYAWQGKTDQRHRSEIRDRRDEYREQVAKLHSPERHAYVAVAEAEDSIAGYIAWSVDPARGDGSVTILAVPAEHRRHHVGAALCEHAFDQMRTLGAEVVEISTGGDPFHAPARAL
ncbi:GNAT family N-acetyltransferase [Streptomyces sp. BE303]|nr:GNAT family N-acetyltransferase [Streptomyces sp. BE303]MED7948817.1 GNAT family N-acetyltransferase [Streptomyces sp. BE303]